MARTFRTEKISAGLLITGALWLLVLPLRWLLAALTAALFHELCHVAAVAALGGSISGIGAGRNGAKLEAGGLSASKQLICTLAGPIGGLLLMFAARWVPAVAICGLVQSVYNLLPIWPLDGGQALDVLLRMVLSPRSARKIRVTVERMVLIFLCAAALYGSIVLKMGLLPVFVPLAVILKKNSLQTRPETSTIEGNK